MTEDGNRDRMEPAQIKAKPGPQLAVGTVTEIATELIAKTTVKSVVGSGTVAAAMMADESGKSSTFGSATETRGKRTIEPAPAQTAMRVVKEPQQWFVMNAYKAEQRAEDNLRMARDIEYFIPKQYVLRTYHGRKERKLVPLIPNLVFIRARYSRIEEFKRVNTYLRYCTRKIEGVNRIMKVPDKEMADFIRVSKEREEELRYIRPGEEEIPAGVRVRVHGGSLDGVEGTVVKLKGFRSKRLVLQIQDLLAVSIQVEPDMLEVLK